MYLLYHIRGKRGWLWRAPLELLDGDDQVWRQVAHVALHPQPIPSLRIPDRRPLYQRPGDVGQVWVRLRERAELQQRVEPLAQRVHLMAQQELAEGGRQLA